MHRRIAVVALAMLVAVCVGGPAAVAQDPAAPAPAPERVTIFVIDLSGSMNEPFAGGGTKLDAAKAAFSTAFNNAVGRGGRIAIRTYGDQLAPQSPGARQQNCETDTRLAVPLSDLSSQSAAVVAEVAGFQGKGDTPVGLALNSVAADIPAGAQATVVLFSDGRDECHDADLDGNPAAGPSWGPNPCEVAASLKAAGAEVRTGVSKVETIGFVPDPAAETELKCIAEKTGGSYTAVNAPGDIQQLEQLLVELASPRKAVRLPGTPIVGTAVQAGAPTIPDLTGDSNIAVYTDRLVPNEDRWYRSPTYGPGWGNFTATVFDLPAQEGIAIKLTIAGVEGSADKSLEQERANAGLPRAPSASVRCPGCYWQGVNEDKDTFFRVRLESAQPLTGTYDVEIQIEGEAYGGSAIGCQEPAECFFSGQTALYEGQRRVAQDESEQLRKDAAPAELVKERDRLAEQIADRQARLADPDRQTTTTTWWPLLLAGFFMACGVALGITLVRRAPTAALDADGPAPPSGPETGFLDDPGGGATPQSPGGWSPSSTADLTPLTVVTSPERVRDEASGSTSDGAVRPPPFTGPAPPPFTGPAPGSISGSTDDEVPAGMTGDATEVPMALDARGPDRTSGAGGGGAGAFGESATEVPSLPSANWYPDPAGQHEYRWWNGQRWTEDVR